MGEWKLLNEKFDKYNKVIEATDEMPKYLIGFCTVKVKKLFRDKSSS